MSASSAISPAGSSPLLQAEAQLSHGWWAKYMMPHLIAAEAAGNVALTCKQLRGACQNSTTSLSVLGSELRQLHALAHIPAHFPSCKSLIFEVKSKREANFQLPAALDVLVGLQALTSLQLDLGNTVANNPGAMAAALGALVPWQLRQQQYQQHSHTSSAQQEQYTYGLTLVIEGTWQGHKEVWQALGRLTQLSRLAVHTGTEQPTGVRLAHMSALAPLSSCLQSLELSVGQLQGPNQDCSFVSSLTHLTGLTLTVAGTQGLASVAHCSSLHELHLQVADPPSAVVLGVAECAAVARLVQLRELVLGDLSASDPTLGFLSSLQQLQSLCLDGLSPAAVPRLAELTRLTALKGDWVAQQENPVQGPVSGAAVVVSCPSVRRIHALGPVPFEAFPVVEVVVQWGCWQPSAFISLAQHCKHLRELQAFDMEATVTSTFDPAASTATCVQALHALAPLQQLTHLSLSPRSYAEVAALAELTQLRSLRIALLEGGSCTLHDLSQLAAVRQLQQLRIVVPHESGAQPLSVPVARQLLVSVRHVAHVKVDVHEADANALHEARDAIAADGCRGLGGLMILAGDS